MAARVLCWFLGHRGQRRVVLLTIPVWRVVEYTACSRCKRGLP